MSPGTLTAQRMSAAVASDPQFAVPKRPKLVDGLAIVALERGLLVEGGPERQLLRGAASRRLLPELLGLLDGTRDVVALAAQLEDETPTRIAQAVNLLYGCGLIEAGEPGGVREPTETATFLSRTVDSTRANRNADEALTRLAAAHVPVAGPSALAARLVDELTAAGVGRAEVLTDPARPAPGATLVVGVVTSAEDEHGLAALDARCAHRGNAVGCASGARATASTSDRASSAASPPATAASRALTA